MRWILVLSVVALVSALVFAAFDRESDINAETITITPVADTWVGEDRPEENFGGESSLEVDGSAVQQTFLRFDVDGIDATVTAATLRLYAENPSSAEGGTVATISDNGWDELEITWNTRPDVDGPVIATTGAIERAAWVEFDVTAGVETNGPITFVITSGGSDGAAFAARESDTPPELVITHGGGPRPELTPIPVLGGTQRSTSTPGGDPNATAAATVTSAPPTATFVVPPVAMPGSVEAEDYRLGGEGVGYHDTSTGNNGGHYRQDNVDIETCEDASSGDDCYSIGYIRAAEWLAYDLVFAEAGEFAIALRVASWNTGRELHIEIDGRNVSGPIVVPNTGGPQVWADVVSPVIVFPSGTVTLRIVADDEGFNLNRFTVGAPVADAVLVGSGDVGECNSNGDEQTAEIVKTIDGTVFITGDTAYPDGTAQNFVDCYDPSWGQFKDRTRPAIGNHEYNDPDAQGYFDYFGEAAGEPGKGYYAYTAGTWRVIVLNSNCSRGGDLAGCDPNDPQLEWLREELAANQNSCTVAYWHHPRWSSGEYGDDVNMSTFWEVLYDAGADVVLSGHEHYYERFAPLDADGNRDDQDGMRQFIIGTGGGDQTLTATPREHSEVIGLETYGVLKLTLKTGGYDWEYVPVEGSTFTDSGSGSCR